MYIIIVGGGEIGYYLAKTLLSDDHEVLIIEKDAKNCEAVAEELGNIVVHGDGCEAATLEDSGTGRADMLIAITGDDEDNLVAAQVAKHKFNVPRTIARIKNPQNETIFKKLGIDVTVSSTDLILSHIEQEIPSHPLVPLLKLRGGDFEIVKVNIPPNSSAAGKRLGDISLPPDSLVCLVASGVRGLQIPTKDTIIETEDEIVAVTKPETEQALRAALAGV